jgi:hypothetical protein
MSPAVTADLYDGHLQVMQHDGPSLPAAPTTPGAETRKTVYALLVLVAASIVGTRLLTAPPSFSVNDRSRWATIRALVDTGSYAIGRRFDRADRTYEDRGILTERGWRSSDVVMHPNTRRFYSSKPTLLPTLLAGEYWLLRRVLHLEITSNRAAVSRTILLTINWLPFVLYLLLLARLVERLGTTDWGRQFVFTAACFGTFVSGFLSTLNNHTVAAHGALFAVYHCLRIALDSDRRWWRFALAGLFAGWTLCNELPAVALAAGLTLWLLWLSPRHALYVAIPAMLVPVAGSLYTQHLATGSIVPTYAHAQWYRYEGSYWTRPFGLDRANDGKFVYAFHLLTGHSGILSLTPVLLLGWIGMVRTALVRVEGRTDMAVRRTLACLTLVLTLVTFGFYVVRTANYGGLTAGPRWFFWLVPLWLLAMLPEADRWGQSRWRRWLASVLLVISIGSAYYALRHPWRHSWLFALLRDLGLVNYP